MVSELGHYMYPTHEPRFEQSSLMILSGLRPGYRYVKQGQKNLSSVLSKMMLIYVFGLTLPRGCIICKPSFDIVCCLIGLSVC